MIRFKDDAKEPGQIGIAALGYLGQHDDLLQRFLDLSGLDVGQLRGEATDLIYFAASIGADPRSIGVARNKLAEKAGISGEDYPA